MKRIVPFSAAGWEVLRFFILFLVMTVQLNRQLQGEIALFLLWISVVSLVAAAALFLAGTSPDRYSIFVKLAAVLKILQLFFGVVLVLYIQGVIPAVLSIIRNEVGSMQGVSMLSSSLPAIMGIVGVDFLSALFLTVYVLQYPEQGILRERSEERIPSAGGGHGGEPGRGGSEGETLPKTELTRVEEED
ncbi:MAG: hypothetical protein R6V67_08155 [Spirochaetia bacterium]